MSFCVKCHHADGRGEPMKYPALAGNPAVLVPNTTSLIRLLLQGGRSPETRQGPRSRKMPEFGDKLTDTEISRVLNFVRGAWGRRGEFRYREGGRPEEHTSELQSLMLHSYALFVLNKKKPLH